MLPPSRSSLLSAATLSLLLAPILEGCKADLCASEAPSFQLDLSASSEAQRAASSMQVSVVGGEIRARRTYDLGGQLADGSTALVVVLDPPPAAALELELEVVTFAGAGGTGAELGRAAGRFSASPDACNQFSLSLGGAMPVDGGPPDAPAPDLGVDLGLVDAADGGLPDAEVDLGVDAGELPDAGEPDAAEADADTPDLGEPDGGFEPIVYPYAPSNFDPSNLPVPVPGLIDCGATLFDTGTLAFTNWCGSQTPSPLLVDQTGGPQAVLLALDGLVLAAGSSLRVTGTRPLILAVSGTASVEGEIDVGARATAAGPGGSVAGGCSPGTGANGSFSAGAGGGGGGGGHGLLGGIGGEAAIGANGGGAGGTAGTPENVPLRGGCSGGLGGGTGRGDGGAGGGALQISSTGVVSIGGQLLAGGGGGRGGASRSGGGGGGSGGAILLEGSVVSVGGLITALGGGGGGGGDDGATAGQPGGDALASAGLGGPGGGGGGSGGAGSAGADPGAPGSDGDDGRDAGGGGGGGPGRIRVNASGVCSVTGTVSPALTGCP